MKTVSTMKRVCAFLFSFSFYLSVDLLNNININPYFQLVQDGHLGALQKARKPLTYMEMGR